jgi:Protein of unknown function (DUF1569)
MIHFGDPKVRELVVQRLALLTPDTKARWGKMSAGQMICHLNDSYLGVMGLRSVSPASGPLQRTVIKWAALYLPTPWPKGTPTRPEVEQGRGGTPPVDFESDRKALVTSIARFCDPKRTFTWAPQPIFGPMTDRQWMRWGYLHSDHHLRQFGL